MSVGVGAQQVRQHQRINPIRLGPRHPVAVAVTIHRHRVDREHPIADLPQRVHEQAAIGLQRDPDLAAGRSQTIQQLDQGAESGKIITDPLLGQHPTRQIDDRDVVVLLGPVDPAVNLHRRHVLPDG
jgi:hypothetical protein